MAVAPLSAAETKQALRFAWQLPLKVGGVKAASVCPERPAIGRLVEAVFAPSEATTGTVTSFSSGVKVTAKDPSGPTSTF